MTVHEQSRNDAVVKTILLRILMTVIAVGAALMACYAYSVDNLSTVVAMVFCGCVFLFVGWFSWPNENDT